MMRRAKKLAAGIAAAMMVSVVCAPVSYAADNAFGIDELNWTDQDWESIAMTNDDTVDTGAVIRTKADADSEAAGYLYRGAGVQVIDKGEEWTEVRSGRVEGYVKNEFLAFGDEARGLAAHYGQQGIIANWDDVSVFSDDQADAPVERKVGNGTPMNMLEDNGHWITVQHGADSAGFVSEEDVTRVLLVDTAVPADGEDDEAPAAMTEEVARETTVSPAAQKSARQEQAAASYARYMEILADGSGESAVDTEPAVSEEAYQEEAASGDTYAVSAASEETYTQTPAPEETCTEPAASETSCAEPAVYTEQPAEQTYATQTVSDNADIQALYDAYIKAQNAAMNCTSESDAKTKADAAVAAWNAYLAACGDSSAAGSASTDPAISAPVSTETTSSTSESTYTEPAAAESTSAQSTYTEETSAPTEAQTAAETQTASSSGSNAYGSYSDLDLLAAIIWCEAGNQPYDGMVAVGQVVMNRVASSSFPNSIPEVLNQPGQFTPASSGTLQAALAAGVNENCYQAAQAAMGGAAPVPGYPLYFNTHSGSYQLGAHYFS